MVNNKNFCCQIVFILIGFIFLNLAFINFVLYITRRSERQSVVVNDINAIEKIVIL